MRTKKWHGGADLGRRMWGVGGGRRLLAGGLTGLMFLLAACAHEHPNSNEVPAASGQDAEINVMPVNYRPDILGAMHAYLNDPTGIRDAEIAPPALKTVGGYPHYVVCLRFNARKRGTDYAGVKEIAAVFLVGRFDRFLDKAQEQCAGASFAPFPELQKLAR
jgi:hypothetical protein